MASFSLVIEYLTGYAVATDSSSRERAEWPPHPARVYMAMAAAHFETDGPVEQKRAEREALEWLATLPPPDLVVPPHSVRDVAEVYVPVNSQSGIDALAKRSRQPRTFPRVHIGESPVRFIWRTDSEDCSQHVSALESVCRNVTRIGHSSSLVWARIEHGEGDQPPTLVCDDHGITHRLRVVDSGILDRLEAAFNADAIDSYARYESEIARSAGAVKKKLRQQAAERFPMGPPTSQRPTIGLYQGYRPPAVAIAEAHPSIFDPHFVVLRATEDAAQTFGLESTAQLVAALRGAILATFGDRPIPAWVSGHEANGEKLQSGPHVAMAPLAFVGSEYADGHLLGLAIMIPRTVPLAERGRALSALLFDSATGAERRIRLTLGPLGTWDLVRESATCPKQTLQTQTYTEPSRTWASVTPIVLDRMPKTDRSVDPLAWRQEVASILATSCANVGLPAPINIRVEKTPFFRGSLRAMPGQGGFPRLRADKVQVHAAMEFDREIAGPMLLGAGRYRGYGLMRPWDAGEQ